MEASEMQPDVVSYNTVINVCAHNDRPEEARVRAASWVGEAA